MGGSRSDPILGGVGAVRSHLLLGDLVEVDVDGWGLGKLPLLVGGDVRRYFAGRRGVAKLVECGLAAR